MQSGKGEKADRFTKRIIPCLDVKNGRVVKGVNFVDLKDAGDPVAIAKAYDEAGADELVFLDITASSDNRATVADMVSRVADQVFIPFTVGGGIRTVEDFKAILREGADKISVNSAAINDPELILADEPTGNLDSKSGKIVLDALKEINGWGKTIIMVTHDPQMASNCKKVILLKDGVILKTLEGKGDSEEERERYYREILGEMEQL